MLFDIYRDMTPASAHPSPTRPNATSQRQDSTGSPKVPGTSPRPQVRPPSDGKRLPLPGTSDRNPQRRTAQHRAMITPQAESGDKDGFSMTDPYVRRFWIAAIGPGAVADLLRLAAAAQSGRSLPIPVHLPALLRERLARYDSGMLIVPDRVPPLPPSLVDRLAPPVRRQFVSDRRRRLAV